MCRCLILGAREANERVNERKAIDKNCFARFNRISLCFMFIACMVWILMCGLRLYIYWNMPMDRRRRWRRDTVRSQSTIIWWHCTFIPRVEMAVHHHLHIFSRNTISTDELQYTIKSHLVQSENKTDIIHNQLSDHLILKCSLGCAPLLRFSCSSRRIQCITCKWWMWRDDNIFHMRLDSITHQLIYA